MNPGNEPIRFAAAIAGAVHALVILLIELDVVNLTANQVGAIMGFEGAVVIVAQMLYGRSQSTPNTTVDAKVDAAVAAKTT